MKRCFKCGEDKPLTEFYRHGQMKAGLLGKCKECTRSDTRANRLARIEYYREYDRARASMPHRMQKNKEIGKRWRRAFPMRRKAQVALNNALRDGRIEPWPACAIPECACRPEAHHTHYDAPLEVVWLCSAHHKQAHAMARTL